jgi:tetratricopeptide (TPR) repeat protein
MKSFPLFKGLLCMVFIFCVGLSCSQTKEEAVTVQEAKDFARQLQSSIEKRNGDFFDEAIDADKFLKKAGLNSEKDARSFGEGLSEKMNIGTQLVRSLSKKGTYELVKQYEKDKKQHLLFRLYYDGSLNYHDIELTRSGNETKIADMFIYTSGELFSETMNNLYRQMKTMMSKGETSFEDRWLLEMPRLKQKLNSGEYEEAMEIFDRLPEKIKKMKAVQLTHIMIASGLDDMDKYAAAIDEYTRLYPNEPNMHLILLDSYIMKQQYDEALHSVNELDRMIDKDPFLDYYRYLIYNIKEDSTNARASIIKLMNNMPDFEDGMLELIVLYVEEKNNKEADKWIKEFRSHGSFDQDQLETLLTLKGYQTE